MARIANDGGRVALCGVGVETEVMVGSIEGSVPVAEESVAIDKISKIVRVGISHLNMKQLTKPKKSRWIVIIGIVAESGF